MEATQVYQDYLALKSHFAGKYDYQKYGGKLRTSEKGFNRDKLFYQKIAKHPDAHRFLLANIMEEPKIFIRTIAYSQDAERIYTEFVARTESLGYRFKQDLKKMDGDLNSNLYACNHPPIMLLYLSNEIMLETLCIVTHEASVIKHWRETYPYDPVIEEMITKIQRYHPFIDYDRAKFRKFIADEFADRN